VSELDQVLGTRVRIRACVDEHGRAPERRDDDRDSRTVNSGEPPDVEKRGCEHRPRVPCRDDRIGVALGNGTHGANARRVGLRPHRLDRMLVHVVRLGRRDEGQA
jgi:hypothetical protein